MRRIFVDTSAWDALADSVDPNHEVALLFRDEIAGGCSLVVTNYILDELYTLLLMNLGYQRAVDFKRKLDVLVQEGVLEVVWVSDAIASEAWTVFERFNREKEKGKRKRKTLGSPIFDSEIQIGGWHWEVNIVY